MKISHRTLAVLLLAGSTAAAQELDKEVIVTRPYTPSLSTPDKLSPAPRMEDTVQLRPELDYSITPREADVPIGVEPIRPATTGVWTQVPPRTLYLRAGAGYPLNTTGDLYASWHDAARGNAGLYANHTGWWSGIRARDGRKRNADRMQNRAGGYAEHLVGRRYQAGIGAEYAGASVDRYASLGLTDWTIPGSFDRLPVYERPNDRSRYHRIEGRMWIGSSFEDLSYTNFRIEAAGGYFGARTDGVLSDVANGQSLIGEELFRRMKPAELFARIEGRVARAFGIHLIDIRAAWHGFDGRKESRDHSTDLVEASALYRRDGARLRMKVGVRYAYEHYTQPTDDGVWKEHTSHVFPVVELRLRSQRNRPEPYLEVDGELLPNDLKSLFEENPYTYPCMWGPAWERTRIRLGASGATRRGTFSYNVWAAFRHEENMRLWQNVGMNSVAPLLADHNRVVFGAELRYAPLRGLIVEVEGHGYVNDIDTPILWGRYTALGKGLGLEKWDAKVRVAYDHRSRFTLALSAEMIGRRTAIMSVVLRQPSDGWRPGEPGGLSEQGFGCTLPAYVDVAFSAEVRVSAILRLFGQVHNLLDRKLVRWPYLYEPGVNFTAGVQLSF